MGCCCDFLRESLPGIVSVFSLTSIVCILFASCLWIAEGTSLGMAGMVGSATRCMNCFLDFAEFHWSNFERENANLPLRDYSVTYRPDLYPRGVYVRPQKLICKPWLINHVSSSYCLVMFNPSSLLKGWYSVCIISLPVLNSNAQLYYVLFAGLDFTFSICLPFVVLKLSL